MLSSPFKRTFHEILYQIHEISQARGDYCGLGIEEKARQGEGEKSEKGMGDCRLRIEKKA
jgi:hypothetical protein